MFPVFISLIKFSKIVFAVWNFVRSLKFYYKNNLCPSLIAFKINWIGLFYFKLNGRKWENSLCVFQRNSPKYSNDQRGKLDWNLRREKHRITRNYSAKLQTTKQTFTTSKHVIEFTYSDFPCHFKVNRDKLALTNCLRNHPSQRLTTKVRDVQIELEFRNVGFWGEGNCLVAFRKLFSFHNFMCTTLIWEQFFYWGASTSYSGHFQNFQFLPNGRKNKSRNNSLVKQISLREQKSKLSKCDSTFHVILSYKCSFHN